MIDFYQLLVHPFWQGAFQVIELVEFTIVTIIMTKGVIQNINLSFLFYRADANRAADHQVSPRAFPDENSQAVQ